MGELLHEDGTPLKQKEKDHIKKINLIILKEKSIIQHLMEDTDFMSKMEMKRKPFYFSIRKVSSCLFSRRNGYIGKVILGYSVCVRLFNFDIL